jgi:hypothetical protein
MDRRAIFFLVAAVVSALLVPMVPDDAKYPHVSDVGPLLAGACALFGLLSYLDHRSRTRDRD